MSDLHICEPPIGPDTPDAWRCPECMRPWVRREPDDPEILLSWRKVADDGIDARCPYCRLKGCWLFPGGAEIDGNRFIQPKGHTVWSTGDDSAHRTDTCPVRTPKSRLYDPRPPWAPEETAMSEVIVTGAGDRYHVTEDCPALQSGRLGGEVQGYQLHDVHQFANAAEAEAAGWTACGTCRP